MSKDKSFWNKIKKDIDSFLGTEAKNKKVYTADNSEHDFYELGDDATPASGDKARFNGKPAGESNNGEYVMPSGETYKFVGEELTEIVPKEEDNTLETENAALKTEVENLKKKINTLTARSEEHTSELQSRESIVCRLRLEKK